MPLNSICWVSMTVALSLVQGIPPFIQGSRGVADETPKVLNLLLPLPQQNLKPE